MKKILCEIYSRVVGYFRPVKKPFNGALVDGWNPGKVEEFGDRLPYDAEESLRRDERRRIAAEGTGDRA